jgi:MFS family permease
MLSVLASERFGYRQTASVSFMGTVSGMVLLLFMTEFSSLLLLIAFVPVFGLCMGVRGPIVASVAARYFAGPNVATIYGTIYSTNALGAAFGSWMGGLLHDLTGGYRAGLGLGFVFLALAAGPCLPVSGLRNFR